MDNLVEDRGTLLRQVLLEMYSTHCQSGMQVVVLWTGFLQNVQKRERNLVGREFGLRSPRVFFLVVRVAVFEFCCWRRSFRSFIFHD